jgi:3-hydroxyacyl-CoA dehydrogenase
MNGATLPTPPGKIAVVGAGLVGASWAIVFARAGFPVHAFDADPTRRAALIDEMRAMLGAAHTPDGDAVLGRITITASIGEAVEGADYVQESVFEQVELKRSVSVAIGEALAAEAIVGSSTSGFPASTFTAEVAQRARFLVAHPANPPHLIPVVEIVPAPWTALDAVERTADMMRACGQKPVLLAREIDGFVLNRLQGALLDEAWRLLAAGIASPSDIDATISHGLGRRWAFMGPFETIDLNAPGGLSDYAARLAPMYRRIARTQTAAESWDPDCVARAETAMRAAYPIEEIVVRQALRDERLAALRAMLDD